MPVLKVEMVEAAKIRANAYNPNRVAPPEMRLLELSIREDGFTQPIVCYRDGDEFEVVDGFHRFTVGKKLGLERLPVVVIDKPIEQRMASTIRHNRARGTHQISDMSSIVADLAGRGWDDVRICKALGMDLDEVIRLKQVSGIVGAFAGHVFSHSWSEFLSRQEEDEDDR